MRNGASRRTWSRRTWSTKYDSFESYRTTPKKKNSVIAKQMRELLEVATALLSRFSSHRTWWSHSTRRVSGVRATLSSPGIHRESAGSEHVSRLGMYKNHISLISAFSTTVVLRMPSRHPALTTPEYLYLTDGRPKKGRRKRSAI